MLRKHEYVAFVPLLHPDSIVNRRLFFGVVRAPALQLILAVRDLLSAGLGSRTTLLLVFQLLAGQLAG